MTDGENIPVAEEPAAALIPMPSLENEAAAQPAAAGPATVKSLRPTPPQGAMSDEVFHDSLCKLYTMGGARFELQTLIHAPQDPSARDAHNALYDTICEIPWLHFLIIPGNTMLGRIVLIGVFFGGLGFGCYMELVQKQEAALAQAKARAPENDNAQAGQGAQ